MELQPALATAWEATPDGKTWTFKLRQGVKFHDGTPFTSQAVKVTIEHLLDAGDRLVAPGELHPHQGGRRPRTTARSASPTDPPTPDLPFLMADGSVRIISPAALQKFGKDFGRNPVGTGPYVFEEWIPNQRVSLEANPDYWGPKPQVRRCVYRPIPEAAGRVVALKTGEADVVLNLPAADVDALKQDPNVTVTGRAGPDDHRGRAAPVEAAVQRRQGPLRAEPGDRQGRDHRQRPARGWRCRCGRRRSPACSAPFDFEPLPYDPAKAKQLLAEAGYPNGFEATIRYVSGRWSGDDQVAEAMQGFWNNVGIRTTDRQDPERRAGAAALGRP